MSEMAGYKECIFEKLMSSFDRYNDAKINLYVLDRKQPRPQDYELKKTLYSTQMMAAEMEMEEIIFSNT